MFPFHKLSDGRRSNIILFQMNLPILGHVLQFYLEERQLDDPKFDRLTSEIRNIQLYMDSLV